MAIDGNTVTAKAVGYVDMAFEPGEIMNHNRDKKDRSETADFSRHFVDLTR